MNTRKRFFHGNKIPDVLGAMKVTSDYQTTVHDPLQPYTSPSAPPEPSMPTDAQVLKYLENLIEERMQKRQDAGFWKAVFSEDSTIEQSAAIVRDYIAAKLL